MSDTLKVRRVGNTLGATFPQKMIDSLNLAEGDELHVTYTEDGVRIAPYDPDFENVVEDAREFMRSHEQTFQELAK